MKVLLLGLLAGLVAASAAPKDVTSARPCSTSSSKPKSTSHVTTSASGSVTTKTTSSRTTSASPSYETCPYAYPNYNAFTNPEFTDGLKGWTTTSNSKHPKAVKAYNGSAIMSFPKGKVITSSLSQTVIACNGYVEAVYFQYNLTRGGGCVLTTTMPPFGKFYTAHLDKVGDFDTVTNNTIDWGPGPENTAQHLPLNVTVKCNGKRASTVVLDGFSLYGIG